MENGQVETAAAVACSTPSRVTAPNIAEAGGMGATFSSLMPTVFFSRSKEYLTGYVLQIFSPSILLEPRRTAG